MVGTKKTQTRSSISTVIIKDILQKTILNLEKAKVP